MFIGAYKLQRSPFGKSHWKNSDRIVYRGTEEGG